jgi:hypothetical protein
VSEDIVTLTEGWEPYDPCPCACGEIGHKLKKNGHVTGCKCRGCIGKRNKSKGQAAQRKVHQALGGVGPTPTHEESGRALPVFVMPEVKTGGQVPELFWKFLATEWFRRAFRQAEKSIRAGDGSGVRPSVSIVKGSEVWLITKLK